MRLPRLATEEEIKSIQESADLMPGCIVLAIDTPKGPVLAVVRTVVELDPVYFPEGLDNRNKAFAVRDVLIYLKGANVPVFYFNVDAEDAQWRQVIENFGAEATTKAPQIRYKKLLV